MCNLAFMLYGWQNGALILYVEGSQ
jgi:hypothetical protein